MIGLFLMIILICDDHRVLESREIVVNAVHHSCVVIKENESVTQPLAQSAVANLMSIGYDPPKRQTQRKVTALDWTVYGMVAI